MQDRLLDGSDFELLNASLEKDTYHIGTKAEFFVAPGTVCKVVEDEKPILFVRGTKALRVDLCFVDNNDKERNKAAILYELEILKKQAKENGFSELVGCSNSLGLMSFFKELGFEFVAGEMRLLLG